MRRGKKKSSVDDADELVVAQFFDCWRRCDSCRKLRLVQKNCLPALGTETYSSTVAVVAGTQRHDGEDLASDHVDWRKWMQDAESR